MGILKRAFGDPTHEDDEGEVDVYTVTVAGGSTTLTYDEPFDEAPKLVVSGQTGDAGWSANGPSQATITATADDTATVVAIGPRTKP